MFLVNEPPEVLAYFAGFFDGEGSIVIGKTTPALKSRMLYLSPQYNLRITISGTSHSQIKWIHDHFRGCMSNNSKSIKVGRAVAWKWTSSVSHAAAILLAILPYLKIKRPEAELAIEFYEFSQKWKVRTHKGHMGAEPVPDHVTEIKDAYRQKLHELKHSYKQYTYESRVERLA